MNGSIHHVTGSVRNSTVSSTERVNYQTCIGAHEPDIVLCATARWAEAASIKRHDLDVVDPRRKCVGDVGGVQSLGKYCLDPLVFDGFSQRLELGGVCLRYCSRGDHCPDNLESVAIGEVTQSVMVGY